MFVDLIDWVDCSASPSKRCVSLAIDRLDNYFSEANIDDEIVDFTHKGGWVKIDTILCKHSGFDIIFLGDWQIVIPWAKDLLGAAKVLKVSTSPLLRQEELTLASCLQERRPDSEAGEIMRKYAKKWKNIAKLKLGNDYTTDSSAESNDESSDSDSD
jgi:hypothetical protein